jgi:hypothetical protein
MHIISYAWKWPHFTYTGQVDK